jgi:hypothetical protein
MSPMFRCLNMNHCSTYIYIYILLGFMFKYYVAMFRCLNMNHGRIYILTLFSLFNLQFLWIIINCSKILIKYFNLKVYV